MDLAHLHLLFSHLPIFGSIIGALVLVQGIFTKSQSTTRAALSIFFISAIGAGIAYLTGEPAAEKVENLMDVSKAAIEVHEEFAGVALAGMIVLGVFAILAYILSFKNPPYFKKLSLALLVVSIISFVLVARVGYLGGQIRHPDNPGSRTIQKITNDSLKGAEDKDNDKD